MAYWLFEDALYPQFLPLVYFRPIWELWVGGTPLGRKWEGIVPIEGYWARQYLHQTVIETPFPETAVLTNPDNIFINARLWPDAELKNPLEGLAPGEALVCQGELAAFRGHAVFAEGEQNGLVHAPMVLQAAKQQLSIEGEMLHFSWDLIDRNGTAIQQDFERRFSEGFVDGEVHPSATLIEPHRIVIEERATVGAQVVIDASEGHVWIARGATIMHNSVIVGPAYIGPGSTIKIGAKIHENTSLGPVCKIGGEVEGSIVQGYSNKQHDGFLGHAFLGSWVNLGADTNNSDLKNNYGEITVFLNGEPVRTGKRFLGLIMGDHSKTAINTMFNTGTIVGVNCNIFGAEMPPKFVPSFSWGNGVGGFQEYRLDKAMEVARIVMGRRNVPFTEKTTELFRVVFELSQKLEKRS